MEAPQQLHWATDIMDNNPDQWRLVLFLHETGEMHDFCLWDMFVFKVRWMWDEVSRRGRMRTDTDVLRISLVLTMSPRWFIPSSYEWIPSAASSLWAAIILRFFSQTALRIPSSPWHTHKSRVNRCVLHTLRDEGHLFEKLQIFILLMQQNQISWWQEQSAGTSGINMKGSRNNSQFTSWQIHLKASLNPRGLWDHEDVLFLPFSLGYNTFSRYSVRRIFTGFTKRPWSISEYSPSVKLKFYLTRAPAPDSWDKSICTNRTNLHFN